MRGDLAVLLGDVFARAVDDAFLVPLAAVDPVLEDLARDDVALRERVVRVPVDRDLPERVEVDLPPADSRELPRPADADEEPSDASSFVHLPDITRCAASATASAMSAPSFVALDITLFAAWDAVSAASSPASRIARRALGLAVIAAAAAARPAASISLLIAALASFSPVSLPLPA